MEELLGLLLLIAVFFLIPFGIIFYLIRKRRGKIESRWTPDEKKKKYTKEIASFIAIACGLTAKSFTNSWLIGGITAGVFEIIALKYLSKKQ